MVSDVVDQAKSHVSNASLASLDNDLERALSELILASEIYMTGILETKDKTERQHLTTLFQDCAEEAEKIKSRKRAAEAAICPAASQEFSDTSYVRPREARWSFTTVETRAPTRKEQLVLLRASKMGDRIFPLWNEVQVSSCYDTDETFVDPLPIFNEQILSGMETIRLKDYIREPLISAVDMVIHPSLYQTSLNDCSVVASLIVAFQWSSRFRTRLVLGNLHPQDETGEPLVSSIGKYMLKVNLNGSWRQVVIDDYIPVDSQDKTRKISIFSDRYPNVCGPALIQKAYLKVAGLDYQGSNSASDLKLLIGWIPEQISLHGALYDADEVWRRIYQAWVDGEVLITCGTRLLTMDEQAHYKVASEHDYAVTGLRTEEGRNAITLQNPWATGDRGVSGSSDSSRTIYQHILEMDLYQLSSAFATLFLSWNPSLWKYKVSTHFSISADNFASDNFVYHCPQYVLTNATDHDISIFLVLNRHRLMPSQRQAPKVFSALSLYDYAGQRVVPSQTPAAKTDYHASYEVTLRAILPARKAYTCVVTQRGPATTGSMTLTAYHNHPTSKVTMDDPVTGLPNVLSFSSSWTKTTCGGNTGSKLFLRNPHLAIRTDRPTLLTVVLECTPTGDATSSTTTTTTAVNLHLHATHARVLREGSPTLVRSGRTYRRAFQVLSGIALGNSLDYTIVPSTMSAAVDDDGLEVPFTLTLLSDTPLAEARWMASLGAGQLRKTLAGHYGPHTTVTFRVTPLVTCRATFVLALTANHIAHRLSLVVDDGGTGGGGGSDQTLHADEGRGTLGLEKVRLGKGVAMLLRCQVLERWHGGFELDSYSDGNMTIERM